MVGVALICAKLALVPVVFDQASDIPFSVPKSLLSHGLAYALTGVILGLLVQYGRPFLVRSWLHVPVLAFLLANVAATLFAADSVLALYGTHDRRVGLATIADGVLLYFAIVLLVRTRREAVAVVVSGLAASAVVLAYEFVQLAARDPFSWNANGADRPFSTIGQTTNLAEYLTVVAIGAAAIALFDGRLRVTARVILFLYAGLVLVGVVVTQTRSALLGIVVGIALLVLLTWAAHPDRRARIASLVGAVAASIGLAVVLVLTPLGSRLLNVVDISAAAEGDAGPRLEESLDVRVALYRISLEMVRDRPALGYGPDNFLAALPNYRSDHEPSEIQQSPTSSPHSHLAQVAVTSGLIGFFAFVGIAVLGIGLTFRAGFRPGAWAGAAMLVAFLGAGLTTVNSVATDWLFWASVGGIAAVTARPWALADAGGPASRRARSQQPREGPAFRRALGFAGAGLGLLLAFTAVTSLDASHAARSSQITRLQGRTQQAIELGLRATKSDPLRAQYWDQLGLAYISADRLKDAASAFERATALAPYDVRYFGDLARAYAVMTQRGDPTAAPRAREVADRAVRTDPNNPQAQLTRAVVMQIVGDLPEASRSVERALALDPRSMSLPLYVTAAQIFTASGRPADAVTVARRGLAIFDVVEVTAAAIPLRFELARALAAAGQRTEALDQLDLVLRIRPNYPGAEQLRASLSAASNN
jgi:O-antigen ligase/tetratricopeptide (TPR) repeat protein